MIRRSEFGPSCPHCAQRNPAALLENNGGGTIVCIHCEKPFTFWIERLPFYVTDDGRKPRCDCDVCMGKKPAPGDEIPPE